MTCRSYETNTYSEHHKASTLCVQMQNGKSNNLKKQHQQINPT